MEDFFRCVIQDFDVKPQRDDWRQVLLTSRRFFEETRTW